VGQARRDGAQVRDLITGSRGRHEDDSTSIVLRLRRLGEGAPFVARRAVNLHGCAPASLCPPFFLRRGYPRERISYGSGAPPSCGDSAEAFRRMRLPYNVIAIVLRSPPTSCVRPSTPRRGVSGAALRDPTVRAAAPLRAAGSARSPPSSAAMRRQSGRRFLRMTTAPAVARTCPARCMSR